MNDRLSVILTRLRERFAPGANVAELEAYLSSEGFDRGQIGVIVSAFLADLPERAVPSALRVQGPHELGRITAEAWGILLSMRAAGLITPREFEDVVDRAMTQGEGRISVEDVRTALDAAGLDVSHSYPGNGTIH